MLNLGIIKRKIRKLILGYDIPNYYFSQSGEDAMLHRIFAQKFCDNQKGFYVDVGAWHPYQLSNTFFFYLNGWRGVNIDPCPGCMKLFRKIRPEDINIEIGIGVNREMLEYNLINEKSPVNSFIKQHQIDVGVDMNNVKKIPVQIYPLKMVLGENLKSGQKIDFFSIDAEGMDLEVLKSNDWNKYRPTVIVAELNVKYVHEVNTHPINEFLFQNGYYACCKTLIIDNISSVIYLDKDYKLNNG